MTAAKPGRLAVAHLFAKLAADAADPQVPPHLLLARAQKAVAWLEDGAPPKPPRSKAAPDVTAEVQEVFDHWRRVMRKTAGAVLSAERIKLISDRLREGHTVERCKLAIDGCRNDAWHMGANKEGRKYDSIGVIFRATDKMEGFIANAPKAPVVHREAAPTNPEEPPVSAEEAARFAAELRGLRGGRGMASIGDLLPKVGT